MTKTDDRMMVMGINQILGLMPYPTRDKTEECKHQDDGYIYGETLSKRVLRCSLCEDFYEEDK